MTLRLLVPQAVEELESPVRLQSSLQPPVQTLVSWGLVSWVLVSWVLVSWVLVSRYVCS